MSTELAQRAGLAHKRHVKVAENNLAGAVVVAGVWFWAILVVVGVVLSVVDTLPGVTVDGVGLGNAADISQGSAPRIFLLVMGIIVTLVLLPRYLAGGGTRKALVEGFVRAAFFCGLVFAVVALLARLAERFVLDRAGLLPWADFGPQPGGVPLLGTAVLNGAWLMAGAAIAVFYQWFTQWYPRRRVPGLLVLLGYTFGPPLLVVPVVLAELCQRDGLLGEVARDWVPAGFLGGVVGVLAALTAGFVATLLLERMLTGYALAPLSSSIHMKVR